MVIGGGLIANSLKEYENSNEIVVFASGVSNSLEISDSQFLREENLILQQLSSNPSALFIYFSTCSIFDNSLTNTPYVHHKKRMEQLISDKFSNYLIMRLPTVIGQTSNMNTFFNNIRIRLKSSLDIHVFQKATRYLLAIDDLPTITKLLLENNVANRVINVAFNNKASVPEIVLFMKDAVGGNSNLIFVDKGSDLIISNDDFLKIVELKKNDFLSVDYKKLIKNYI